MGIIAACSQSNHPAMSCRVPSTERCNVIAVSRVRLLLSAETVAWNDVLSPLLSAHRRDQRVRHVSLVEHRGVRVCQTRRAQLRPDLVPPGATRGQPMQMVL